MLSDVIVLFDMLAIWNRWSCHLTQPSDHAICHNQVIMPFDSYMWSCHLTLLGDHAMWHSYVIKPCNHGKWPCCLMSNDQTMWPCNITKSYDHAIWPDWLTMSWNNFHNMSLYHLRPFYPQILSLDGSLGAASDNVGNYFVLIVDAMIYHPCSLFTNIWVTSLVHVYTSFSMHLSTLY